MFDSISGTMLTKQIVLIRGQRITDVGPEGSITIPGGSRVIDLSQATVLPGLIDTHDHFMTARGNMTGDQALLVALKRLRDALENGFTAMKEMTSHGNGYQDVTLPDMINMGVVIGPRVQVSGRGIIWGGPTPGPKDKPDPQLLHAIVVHNAEEARAAVRFEVEHGVDHIKLYPVGGWKFSPTGDLQFEMTYPLEVMQALDDEAERLGVKTGSHAYGGEGLQNAITAGHSGDSIEHGQGLTQEMCNEMANLVNYVEIRGRNSHYTGVDSLSQPFERLPTDSSPTLRPTLRRLAKLLRMAHATGNREPSQQWVH